MFLGAYKKALRLVFVNKATLDYFFFYPPKPENTLSPNKPDRMKCLVDNTNTYRDTFRYEVVDTCVDQNGFSTTAVPFDHIRFVCQKPEIIYNLC